MERELIKESFAVVEPQADRVAAYFYARLFVESPELRQMFPPAMDVQRDRLFGAVVQIVQGADQPEFLDWFLNGLGRDHRKFGVKAAHYEALGRALLAAIARYAGDAWTPEVEAAWVAAYARAARTMLEAAREAALDSPDWWLAEVVSHELRASDIAVLQLRPDQPFPYTAGQYCSIETPWWPRVWRSYSMANAPREDNLIELQVRKIDAGWVSTSLVRSARPGDVVRLGHPTGTMTAERNSDRDVVCIAGGTGLAPLRAVVEDMTRWNWYRRVHLFVGVRRPDELYDMTVLDAIAKQHQWLSVIPVVSEEPRYHGEQGLVVDAALRHGSWANHDVYVSGSARMVRGSIDRLLTSGVSLSRVRFDSFGDLR
ncbi:MAG TPA: globin domain-containing protein [Sporichthyaceae bacterium]|jgi:NAD(P)H-flavin reductase